MDGSSLQALLAGGRQDSQPPLFGETDYPRHFGWAPLRCVRVNGKKLIQAPRPEYYDLGADPHELRNAYSAAEPDVEKLLTLLKQYQAERPAATTTAADAQLPDPKDRIVEENLLHSALLANDRGQVEQARVLLKQVIDKDKGAAVAFSQLGELELKAGNNSQAASYLGKARQLRPGDSTSAFYQGQALFALKDFAGAREALEASLRLLPEQLPARLLLARTYLQLSQPAAAEDQLQAALLTDPQNPEAQLELGRVLLAEKKYAEAADQLKGLAAQKPSVQAFELLQQAYQGEGKQKMAADAGKRAEELRKNGAPERRKSPSAAENPPVPQ